MSSLLADRASFYYIESVTQDNFYLDFDEGGPEITATVPSGDYTMEQLADVIQDALNSAGTETYTVTLLRDERKYNISSTGSFSLLVSSGTHNGFDIYSLIGFTGSDLGPGNTFTGNLVSGTEYLPQFPLQSYIDKEDLQSSLSVSVNKSANGKKVEVIKFGVEKFFEFEIRFITNVEQDPKSVIENNPTGLQDARLFMRFVVSKRELEFMPNRLDKATFYNLLIERTEEAKDGTGYKMQELYMKGLPGFFDSGTLKFKLIEDE